MSPIRPNFVRHDHEYTAVDLPWCLDEYQEAHGETSKGKKFGWRLFHYLSGGGMRTFGRTVEQEVRSTRQRRFLWFAGAFVLVWVAILVFSS